EDHAPVRHAETDAALHELAHPQGQELAAHEPGHGRPVHDGDRQYNALHRRRQDSDEEDGEQERRDGLEELRRAHEEIVDPAPVVTGEAPDDGAEHYRDRRGEQADAQRRAGAVGQSGRNVAPEDVGAEEVRAQRRRERTVDGAKRTAGKEQRPARREGDDRGEHDHAEYAGAAAREPTREALHGRIRGSSSVCTTSTARFSTTTTHADRKKIPSSKLKSRAKSD